MKMEILTSQGDILAGGNVVNRTAKKSTNCLLSKLSEGLNNLKTNNNVYFIPSLSELTHYEQRQTLMNHVKYKNKPLRITTESKIVHIPIPMDERTRKIILNCNQVKIIKGEKRATCVYGYNCMTGSGCFNPETKGGRFEIVKRIINKRKIFTANACDEAAQATKE